jgi:hypothetical protein
MQNEIQNIVTCGVENWDENHSHQLYLREIKFHSLYFLMRMVVLTIGLMITTFASAEESNRNEVRYELSQNGWRVAYGRLLNEATVLRFKAAVEAAAACTAATAGSAIAACSQIVTAYLGYEIEQTVEKIWYTLKDHINRETQ